MTRAVLVLALCLTGCMQQEPGSLAVGSRVQVVPGQVETLPPEALRDPVPALLAVDPEGEMLPVKPLAAAGRLTMTPVGMSAVSEVRQITVQFDVANAYAPTPVAVEFVDPNGRPYYREDGMLGLVPPTVDRLVYTMPVAATAIDTAKLTGVWAVRLLVDGNELSTLSFELTR